MRVITGTARGMKLTAPSGLKVRPTSDMAKEAIFSIVQNEVMGADVLDLFAGSGQIGIEALSRGAKSAVFTDSLKEAIMCVKQNLEHTKLVDKAQVILMDGISFLESSKSEFDIIFIDPPYGQGLAQKALEIIASSVREGGAIICETDKKEDMPKEVGEFAIYREYKYGKAKVTLYRRPNVQQD